MHLRPPREPTPGARKCMEISFYVMSADAFKCPSAPTSLASERLSGLFELQPVRVISAEYDDEDEYEIEDSEEEKVEEEEEEDNNASQDENHLAQGVVTEYLSQLHQAYRRCFAKAVYTHLRSNGTVTPHDFNEFREILHTAHLDIDLSEFLDVISAAPTTSFGDIQAQFNSELALYFTPVPLEKSPYYFYNRKDSVAPDTESDGEEFGYNKDTDMEYDHPQPNVHASSSLELCPLFSGETEGNVDSKDFLGMYSLPLVMRMEAVNKDGALSSMTTIPTPDMGLTRALRVVCLVLPPLLGPAKLVHENICTVLHKHKKRTIALLSAKILSSLLSKRPLSDPMLEVVMRHLALLSPSVSQATPTGSPYVQCITLDLQFVERREGNALFPVELKASKSSSTTSPENPAIARLSGDLYTLATKPRLSPETEPLEYWLLLVCKTDAVVATLFTPKGPQTDIADDALWKGIRSGIVAVSRRVNQLILLEHLHESEACADLLLAPEWRASQTPPHRGSVIRDDRFFETKGRFQPGEFACPLVHTITLPLHDRTTPAAAHSLMLSSLLSFGVNYHSTLFVYQLVGRIHYILLRTAASIQSTASAQPQPQSQPSQPSPPPSPSLPVNTLGPAVVTLNIYGVDPAGPEITQHLHQHLEAKLSSNTLTSLSTLLMRNPLLKLTTEDLDFIRPPPSVPSPVGSKPLQPVVLQIPAFVEEPYLFLLLLKHNFMQFLQVMHLSTAAQQREDSELLTLVEANDRIDIRPSEFILMYNHISTPTSTAPFTSIGQGMACISLALLDTDSARILSTERTSSAPRTYKDWTRENLEVTLLPDLPDLPGASASSNPTWSRRLLLRIWSRGQMNTQPLINHLVQCANQTVCEFALETSLLAPTVPLTMEDLPQFMQDANRILSRAKSLSTPSVFGNSMSLPLPSWLCNPFLADVRDAIAETMSVPGLQVFAYSKGMDGVLRCTAAACTSRSPPENNGISYDYEDNNCTYATTGSDFYLYDDEPSSDNNDDELDLASSIFTHESSWFVLGGKKVESLHTAKVPDPTTLFYPAIKDSQLPEPITRRSIVAIRLDAPDNYEQCYKMVIHTYNWETTKLDQLKERFSRVVAMYSLKKYLVDTVTHHKMGLYHHLTTPTSTVMPAGGKLTWDRIETINAVVPSSRRRTTSTSGDKDDNEALEASKKARTEPPQRTKPGLEFEHVFKEHYPTNGTTFQPIKDPYIQCISQSRHLALNIEKAAALRTSAIGSLSILPNSSSVSSRPPLTAQQLESVITIARLVHFRCVPFLFGDHHVEYGSTQPALPISDAFVRNYVEYLIGLGVTPLLVDTSTSTAHSKRVSARAYLQKVFLDGTLLVKISFREASVACELFSVPQFSSHSARHFGEELTKFTRVLHFNSFTYDFHVNQLYRMIKFPSTPSSTAQPKQSISAILYALHQYYPTPPIHASTFLSSFESWCSVTHLSQEIPDFSTNQILEFMMTDPACAAETIYPLYHIGVLPALLIQVPPGSQFADVCAITFPQDKVIYADPDCECDPVLASDSLNMAEIISIEDPDDDNNNTRRHLLHVFVVKVGEVCTIEPPQGPRLPTPEEHAPVVDKLHKAVASASINFQRNHLWNKLHKGNPYSPALTHVEFQILTKLILSRPATQIDPALTQPINLLKMGSSVWHPLLAQLRSIAAERVRQVFADPINHLLIFHPNNTSQLVHIVWNEGEKEGNILLCRKERTSLGNEESDADETAHLSQLITIICHFVWKLFLVKQPS